MSKYNFDKGNSEFGETIKLDGINKKVREEQSTGGRGGNGGGKKRRRKRKRNGGIFVPAIIIGIIAAVVIFLIAFVIMGGGIKPSPDLTADQTTGKEGFYALISSKNSNGKVGFYDFEHDVIYNMAIDENTVVTDGSGSMIKQSTVPVGDMIKAYIDFDNKQVMSVNYTEDVWKRDNILGSAVSVDGDTITIGNTVYNYNDSMIVVFENSIVDIKDISDGDVLCVQGYQNNVWSIRIKESGGYVSVIGWEEIENGTLPLTGKAAMKLDSDKIKVEGGMHTVVIKGDNIEDYTTEVYITPGSEVGINLDSYLSKGEIVFKANVEDYDVYINGSIFEQNEKCELPYGVYTLSVVKDGYNTWFKEVELKEKKVELDIKLEKINERGRITIYSQPAAAEIYIDEEYVGRAPLMLEKAYGDYLVRASLDGYPDSIDVVTISGADMSYTAKLVLRTNNMDVNYYEKYNMWLESPVFDEKTKEELLSIKDNEEEIKERFYKDLEFGTGGLRGVIGAGCNRLNIYTVRKATQGLSDYIKEKGEDNASAVIAYDSRRMSPEFALETAKVFAANGIKAYVFKSLRPTPELSFAVRKYAATAGIVITASHNPPEYNGYKVYWSDGAQVSSPMDKEIITKVNSITDFSSISVMEEKEALEKGLIEYIEGDIDDEYIKNVLNQSRRKTDNKALKVVYTPLNGTGNVPVNRALKEAGFTEVYNVEAQRLPDSEFTTIGYPNPEDKAVFKMGIELAEEKGADIVIATDPDADRIGVAVKEKDGSFSFLTGNMTAAVLCEYICAAGKENGTLPENGVVIKTVVSTPMTDAIAKGFGLGVINVLTGFKYIGAKIKEFEHTKANSFVFGFEESYGCLSGTYARDKDAISAALLVCEAAAYNKSLGMTLTERLEKLYEEYGYFKEETVSVTMKGLSGADKIKGIMAYLRDNSLKTIGEDAVEWECDYKKDNFKNLITGESMPREVGSSDIIKYILADESWVCVRPSGTEPKIKIYIGVKGTSAEDADAKLEALKKNAMDIINSI